MQSSYQLSTCCRRTLESASSYSRYRNPAADALLCTCKALNELLITHIRVGVLPFLELIQMVSWVVAGVFATRAANILSRWQSTRKAAVE